MKILACLELMIISFFLVMAFFGERSDDLVISSADILGTLVRAAIVVPLCGRILGWW